MINQVEKQRIQTCTNAMDILFTHSKMLGMIAAQLDGITHHSDRDGLEVIHQIRLAEREALLKMDKIQILTGGDLD